MATIKVGIDVSDNGTAQKATQAAERLKQAYDAAGASAQKINVPPSGGGGGKTMAAAQTRAASSAELVEYNRQRAVSQGTGASARDFAKQSEGLGGLVRLYATFAANVFAVAAAFNALSRAMDTTNMIKGLDQLGAQSGMALGGLSKRFVDVTDGAISLRESVEAVAKASAAGLSSKQILQIGDNAKKASQALGVDMSDAVSRLTRGITKLEPELLDELGIYTKLEESVNKYALSVGKSAGSLTDYERRQAFANAVLDEANRKFGAIELDTNPYNKLLATFRDVAQTGLELVNKVLAPVVNLLSQSPLALAGILALIGKSLISSALPALGQFRKGLDDQVKASKELLEVAQKRRAAHRTYISELEAEKIGTEDRTSAEKAALAVEQARAQFSKGRTRPAVLAALPTAAELKSTELSQQDLDSLQAKNKEIQKRISIIKSEKPVQQEAIDKRKEELRVLQEANVAINERIQSAKNLNKVLGESIVGTPGRLSKVAQDQRELDKARKAAQGIQLVQNIAETYDTSGFNEGFKKLGTTISANRKELGLFQTAMVGVRGAGVLLAGGLNQIMGVLGPIGMAVGLATSAFSLLDSLFSKNSKQAEETSKSFELVDEALKTIDKTAEAILKKDPLARFSASSLVASAKSVNELTTSLEDLIQKVEAQDKAANVWDKFVNGFKGLWGGDVITQSSDRLTQSISKLLKAASGPEGDEAAKNLKELVGVDPKDEQAFRSALTETPGKFLELAPKVAKEAQNLSNKVTALAGSAQQANDDLDTANKSLTEFITSSLPSDKITKYGIELVKSGNSIKNSLKDTRTEFALLEKLLKNPESLKSFSKEFQDSFLAQKDSLAANITAIATYRDAIQSLQNVRVPVVRFTETSGGAATGFFRSVGRRSDVQTQVPQASQDAVKELEQRIKELQQSTIAIFDKEAQKRVQEGVRLIGIATDQLIKKAADTITNARIDLLGNTEEAIKRRTQVENSALDVQIKGLQTELELVGSQARLQDSMESLNFSVQEQTRTTKYLADIQLAGPDEAKRKSATESFLKDVKAAAEAREKSLKQNQDASLVEAAKKSIRAQIDVLESQKAANILRQEGQLIDFNTRKQEESLDAQIAIKQTALDRLELQNSLRLSITQEQQTAAENLKTDIERLRVQKEQLKIRGDITKAQKAADNRAELEDINKQKQALLNEKTSLQKQLESARKPLAAVQPVAVADNTESAQKRVRDLEERERILQQRVEEASANKTTKDANTAARAAAEQAAAQRARLDSIIAKLYAADSELNKSRALLQIKEQELNDYKQKIVNRQQQGTTTYDDAVKTRQDLLNQLDEKIKEAEEKVQTERAKPRTPLGVTLSQAEAKLKELKDQRAMVDRYLQEDKDRQRKELSEPTAAEQARLTALETRIDTIRNSVTLGVAEVTKLGNALDKARDEINQQSTRPVEAVSAVVTSADETELAKIRQDLSAARTELQTLQTAREAAIREANNVAATAAEQAAQQAAAKVQQLETQLDSLDVRIAGLDKRANSLTGFGAGAVRELTARQEQQASVQAQEEAKRQAESQARIQAARTKNEEATRASQQRLSDLDKQSKDLVFEQSVERIKTLEKLGLVSAETQIKRQADLDKQQEEKRLQDRLDAIDKESKAQIASLQDRKREAQSAGLVDSELERFDKEITKLQNAYNTLKDSETALSKVRQVGIEQLKQQNLLIESQNKLVQALEDAAAASTGAFKSLFTVFATLQKQEVDFTEKSTKLTRTKAAEEEQAGIDYYDNQEGLRNQLLLIDKKYNNLSAKLQAENIQKQMGATKNLFKEKTAAYKIFSGLEKAAAAQTLVLNLQSTLSNIGTLATTVTKGAANLFAQGGFAGFAGVSAMLAVLGSLGVFKKGTKVSTGPSVEDLQKAQTTGQVYQGNQLVTARGALQADPTATAQSIDKSLEIIKNNGFEDLNFTSESTNYLEKIEINTRGLSETLAVSLSKIPAGVKTGLVTSGPVGSFSKTTSLAAGLAGAGLMSIGRGALSLAIQPLLSAIVPGLASSILGVIGGPLGIAVGFLFGKQIDKIFNSIFGGKTTTTLKNFGIAAQGTINSLSDATTALVDTYTTVQTTIKGGLFKRTRVFDKTETQKASDEITEYISFLFSDIKNSFLVAGSTLGVDVSNTLQNYVIEPITISTKDLKPEEIEKAIKNKLSLVFNEIADIQFKSLIEALRDPLEEAGTTLTRLVSQTQLFSQSMLLLGKNVENITGTLKTVIANDLVKAFGSLEEYQSKINFFRENFLSEAERIAPVSQKLTETLQKLGISTSLTREQYKALVLQQDLTTTSGRETFSALLKLGETFNKVTDFAEKAKEKLTGFATTIRNFIKEQTLQIVSPTQGLNYLLQEFQTTIQKGLQGDEKSLGYLTEIAGRTIESARNNARSAREFNLLRAGVIASLSNVATEIESGNVKIVTPQEQTNIILEQIQQNTSTLPEDLAQVLAKEIDAYIPAIAAATTSPVSAPTSDVGYDYGGAPGTGANALGAAYYKGMKMFASGGAFSNSVVSNATMFPLGVMGEAGPEAIMPLTRMGDGSLGVTAEVPFNKNNELNKQLIQEVRELKKEMEKVRMGVEVTATGTNKTFRLLDRVAQNGDSLNVVVTA